MTEALDRRSLDLLKVERDQLAADLAALAEARRPADDEAVIAILAGLAETFQQPLPDDGGLEMYIAALKTVPGVALKDAAGKVVLTHKWPRLPYPSEILEAAEAGTNTLGIVTRTIKRAHDIRQKLIERAA